MRKLNLLLAFITTLFLSSVAFSQNTATLKGTVTDADNGETLIGTTILVKGTVVGTVTDIDGNYILENIDPGTRVIVASFVGYTSVEKEITLTPGETKTLDFQLASDALGLDEVVVTGVVNQKSAIESSVALTSLKPKFIQEFGAQTTAEIFKTIPGIRVEASGGEGNANIAVRGVPVASGGSKFLQLHEDGLPVLQFGDISFGNADIFMRSDLNVARIEALKGGSASTLASNSPAGIINFISKTGTVEGGTIATTLGIDFRSLRTDFEYGAPIGNGVRFHVGGFFRDGDGPRDPGFTANRGGQIKANLTKQFDKGYARVYFKYLNDKSISYLPMPVKVTGSADDPTFESIDGFDLTKYTLQSPGFLELNGVDGDGNRRTSNFSDGMHPEVMAVGTEFNFELGDGWRIKQRARLALMNGTFNSPFPAQVAAADAIATDLAGEGYTLSYANGANAGVPLSSSEINNLNGNGLLMRIHSFDVEMNNLNNFTNDIFLTKDLGNFKVTAGYYKAYQKIAMTWLWQSYLTDVSGENGPRLMNIASADSSYYSENGLTAYGQPFWGNCCTRGYDMAYSIDAPYANVEVNVNEDLVIDASVRYDFGRAIGHYKNNFTAPKDVDGDGNISPVEESVTMLDNANPQPVDYNFDYVSYSIGANYKLDKQKAIYARYSKGGRANADRLLYSPFITAEGETIDGLSADEISQAEVGFKYRSNKYSVIATAFYTDISEQNEEFGKVIQKDFNTYGLELEANANFKNFNILAGATFTKAEIKKSINPDEEGNTPRRVPDLMYNITPTYVFAGGRANIGLSLVGTTKVYAQDDNAIVIPGFLYMNAFIGYNILPNLNIRLNSNNLTNTLGFTEMEGDAYDPAGVNYMRARPITGRATTATLTFTF
jgi:outer membrane receptor protein involved in Fe transport